MSTALECPYCGAELDYVDSFGRLAAHQDGTVLGDIYKCPVGASESDDCESSTFHVAGSFYAYRDDGRLHDGYPC